MIWSFWLFWIVSIEVRNLRHDASLFVICSFKDDVSNSHLHVNLKFRWDIFFSSLFKNALSYRDSVASVVDKWVRRADWLIPTWDSEKSLSQFRFFPPQIPLEMVWLSSRFSEVTGGQSFVQLLGVFYEVKKKSICEDPFIRLSLCSL
jgi:hypothetical protein